MNPGAAAGPAPDSVALPLRWEAAILVALLLLALALRLWTVGDRVLHPDELHYAFDMIHGAETATVAATRDMQCAMLAERRTAHPPLDMLLGRWLWVLPVGAFMPWTAGFLRGFHVLMGIALVALGWGIGRLAGGAVRGLVLAGLLATAPGLVWIARTMYLDATLGVALGVMLLGAAGSWRRGGMGFAALQGIGYGLALATKISMPVLAPMFLVGLVALAPAGTPWSRRWQHLAVGTLAAAGLFLLMADPAAYLAAITSPSDPRYKAEWVATGLSGYLQLLFINLDLYVRVAFWDGTPTLLAWAAVAGAAVLAGAWRVARRGAAVDPPSRQWHLEGYFLLVLISLWPLLLMHHPRLSGPHGYYPIWMLAAVLASGWSPPSRRATAALLALHAAVALGAVAATGLGVHPVLRPPYAHLATEAAHRLLGAMVADRWSNPRILMLGEPLNVRHGAVATQRSAQLARGAIFLVPAREGFTAAGYDWADAVLVAGPPQAMPPEFHHAASHDDWHLYQRATGQRRASATTAELIPLDPESWLLPGGVYPVVGHVALNGEILTSSTTWRLDGRVNFMNWGTGMLHGPVSAENPQTLTLHPPRTPDVDWSF